MPRLTSPRRALVPLVTVLLLMLAAVALRGPLAARASTGASADTFDIPKPDTTDLSPKLGMSSVAPPPLAAHADTREYQLLLNDYVVQTSAKGEPYDNRFDYERLYDAPGRRAMLVRIHSQLFDVAASKMEPKERLAWAINGYNFLVLEVATTHLLVPKRGRLRYLTVQDMHISEHLTYDRNTFFSAYVVEIEGKQYSIDEFERAFIYGGYDRMSGPPPASLDPRAHFATVNGSLGAPPLMPRAYRADSLDLQLDAACRAALALPRHLALDEKDKIINGSAIFNQYAYDWGGQDHTFPFVEQYAPPAIKSAIKKYKLTSVGGYLGWDWKLNQNEHPKAKS